MVHRESEVVSQMGDGVSCGTGAYPASGTGVVLHPMQPEGRPPRLDFVDRSGSQVGSTDEFSIATFELDVIPQTNGFAIFDLYQGGLGDYPLKFYDDHARERAQATHGTRTFELPDASVGVLRFEEVLLPDCGDQLSAQRFGDTGAPALPDPTDLGCFSQMEATAMAGNGAGKVLVLVSHTVTGWDAYWLDTDLRLLQKFTPAELAAEPDGPVTVSALLDGTFAVRFGSVWKYRIQPGATTFEPAPCWLAERPATRVTAIQFRGAYAVTHLQNESSDRTIEVLTSEGQSCGDLSLGGPTGHCDVAIGRDGTITRSAYTVDAGAGNPAECVLQFWPGALGPTGF